MNPALANANHPVNLASTLRPEPPAPPNDDVEGIEVTYLDVEEIELEAATVPAWRPI